MARTLFDEVNNDSPSGLYHALFKYSREEGIPTALIRQKITHNPSSIFRLPTITQYGCESSFKA